MFDATLASVFSALTVILFSALFWRISRTWSRAPTQDIPSPTPPTVHQFSLRIREVPIKKGTSIVESYGSIRDELNSILGKIAGSAHDNVIRIQLCLHSKGDETACGTVTFATSLHKPTVIENLNRRTVYRLDDKFNDITLLYEPAIDAEVE
jgi:hypothetical protein